MASPAKLIEGVDFYMEGDKFVFTAAYHLKRGHCCNSKCRHCPYGLAPGGAAQGVPPARIEIKGLGLPALPVMPKPKDPR